MLEFDEYAAACGQELLRLAFLLTGDAHDAEDLTQETLTRAYERWSRVARAEAPEAYVRRMLVNRFLDSRRRSRESVVDPASAVLERHTDDGADERAADREVMWDALAQVPKQQRAVLVLRYYEGCDDATIAELLGCRASTVRSNAARGLTTLKAHWLHTTAQEGHLP